MRVPGTKSPWQPSLALRAALHRAAGALIALLVLSGRASGELVSDLKTDEVIVFFPTIGYPTGNGETWECQVHGWVYEPTSPELSLEWLWNAFGLLEEPTDDTEKAAIRSKRAALFLVDNERNKHIVIRLDGRLFTLDDSEVNGHCVGRLRLSAEEVAKLRAANGGPGRPVRYRAELPKSDTREFTGEIHLLDPVGVSVISDIDDTIKITQILDRRLTIRNTFLEPFRAVPGMAEVYQRWAREPGTAFHFVSASPWQLFAPLEDFRREAGFPAATYHLKPLRIKDHTLFNFFESPEQHKREAIESIIRAFPQRRFILVGDSGQDDPAIYGDVARRHPGRVARILIRDVTDQPREHERYKHDFRDIPGSVITVFRDPAEIADVTP